LLFPALVFGRGKSAESEKVPINNEWVLCVTAFDYSALPASYSAAGDTAVRRLVDSLAVVDKRVRVSPEYEWYEGYAWSQAALTAEKALAAKRAERDALLYRGEPAWKYRRSLKTIDDEIAKLEEDVKKARDESPSITVEPVFRLTENSGAGAYPAPPSPGSEYKFCRDQKADGFLAGEVTEYYGRIYIAVRLYAVYQDAYIFEDSVIFSADDAGEAVHEISGRLATAISGSEAAGIAVRASPDDAMIVINDSFTGRGELAAGERPPGKVRVFVSAENYETQIIETDLAGGELTSIEVSLLPLDLSTVYINIAGNFGASVYTGAGYAGETPLTLTVPSNQLSYVQVERFDGAEGSAVFVTPETAGESYEISVKLKASLSSDRQQVERARRQYYGAWGRFWIALPVAFIIDGITTSRIKSHNYAVLNSGGYTNGMYNDAVTWNNVRTGAWVAVGLASADVIFRVIRYLYVSNEGTPRIVNRGKQ
jgi:hypothetical protein